MFLQNCEADTRTVKTKQSQVKEDTPIQNFRMIDFLLENKVLVQKERIIIIKKKKKKIHNTSAQEQNARTSSDCLTNFIPPTFPRWNMTFFSFPPCVQVENDAILRNLRLKYTPKHPFVG